MKKLRFLIASGPTREPLDPVRFISNYSTGTMGRRLVEAARQSGHKVTWVECPTQAETARQLQKKLTKFLPKCDVLIMAAAVCDVRPASILTAKIKKEDLSQLRLSKNPDILAGLTMKKKKGQVFIGFGLESSDILKNGFEKLKKKGLELIVLQRVRKNDTPFGDKPIRAILLGRGHECRVFGSITKKKLAETLVLEAQKLYSNFRVPKNPEQATGLSNHGARRRIGAMAEE